MTRAGLFALALTAILSVSGCGAGSPPTPTPEPVTVRFAFGERPMTPYYQKLRDEFQQANPQITVELSEGNPYELMFGGPSGADVMAVDQAAIAMLASRGMLRALGPMAQGPDGLDLGLFYQGAVDAMRWRGELWALPAGVDPQMLYYNKAIFDAKGVAYPTNEWTWNDLLEAAVRIAEPDANPPLYGLVGDVGGLGFLPLLYQAGGGLTDSITDPTLGTLSSDASVAAMQWYTDLAQVYRVMPEPRLIGGGGGIQLLVVSKQVAMWYGAYSDRSGIAWEVPWNFEWGAATQPAGVVRTTVFSLRALAVAAESEHPREAWLWAKYVAEHPGAGYDLPALKAALEDDATFAGEQADVALAARQSLEMGHALPAIAWDMSFFRTFSRALDDIGSGRAPVADAMAEVDQALDEALAAQAADGG